MTVKQSSVQNYPSAKNVDTKLLIIIKPFGTRRCCDVESTSMTLIQRCNNVVCPVGMNIRPNLHFG